MKGYCCKKFTEKFSSFDNDAGAFVRYDHDKWGINGCCGGGCFVVSDMKFCPFCGTELKELEK